jgi:hypothetical protein
MNKDRHEIEPPAYLLNKIMSRIEKEERLLVLKRRIFAFFIATAGLIASLFPALGALRSTLAETGFSEYLSLLFSDPAIVLGYWQNFFATLLETFPVAEVAVLLLIILGAMQTVKFLLRDFKNIRNLQTA